METGNDYDSLKQKIVMSKRYSFAAKLRFSLFFSFAFLAIPDACEVSSWRAFCFVADCVGLWMEWAGDYLSWRRCLVLVVIVVLSFGEARCVGVSLM